jgi:hypothetical protein
VIIGVAATVFVVPRLLGPPIPGDWYEQSAFRIYIPSQPRFTNSEASSGWTWIAQDGDGAISVVDMEIDESFRDPPVEIDVDEAEMHLAAPAVSLLQVLEGVGADFSTPFQTVELGGLPARRTEGRIDLGFGYTEFVAYAVADEDGQKGWMVLVAGLSSEARNVVADSFQLK